MTGMSKCKMSNTLIEGCTVGIDVVTGAKLDISSGSRISRCKEQGILFRGHGVGVFRGEEAVKEAADRGICISEAEISLNLLGDFGVVGDEDEVNPTFGEDMLLSPLERRHLRT